MRRLILWSALVLLLLVPVLGSAQQRLVQIGQTANGIAYVDESNVTALKKGDQLFMLVPMEEHYTNEQFLAKLRNSGSNLEQAAMCVYLYMFTNNGTQYCIPQRFVTDANGKVCADLGSNMELKPVNNSKLLVRAYEAAYKVLERKQRLMKNLK